MIVWGQDLRHVNGVVLDGTRATQIRVHYKGVSLNRKGWSGLKNGGVLKRGDTMFGRCPEKLGCANKNPILDASYANLKEGFPRCLFRSKATKGKGACLGNPPFVLGLEQKA